MSRSPPSPRPLRHDRDSCRIGQEFPRGPGRGRRHARGPSGQPGRPEPRPAAGHRPGRGSPHPAGAAARRLPRRRPQAADRHQADRDPRRDPTGPRRRQIPGLGRQRRRRVALRPRPRRRRKAAPRRPRPRASHRRPGHPHRDLRHPRLGPARHRLRADRGRDPPQHHFRSGRRRAAFARCPRARHHRQHRPRRRQQRHSGVALAIRRRRHVRRRQPDRGDFRARWRQRAERQRHQRLPGRQPAT